MNISKVVVKRTFWDEDKTKFHSYIVDFYEQENCIQSVSYSREDIDFKNLYEKEFNSKDLLIVYESI